MILREKPLMPVPSPERTLHAEELPYATDEEGLCELVHGDLVREPPPGEKHGWIAGNVFGPLWWFVRAHGLGRVYSTEAGFVLARDPDTVRAPDVAFVSAERLDAGTRRGPYFEGAPDLAVEVLSPGNRRAALRAKIRDYLEAGAKAVWVIDPAARTLTIHRPGHLPEILSKADTVDGGAAVPGFRLPVREIFEPE
ncbi:MAG: Uma2 family endonuclease [Acidobacteriota bacterium]